MRYNYMRLVYVEDLLFSNRYLLKNLIETNNSEAVFQLKHEAIIQIDKLFPNVSEEEKYKFLYLLISAYFRDKKEKMKLIWSGPSVAGLPGRDTELVFEELIDGAQRSIILTIYSLSEYGVKLIKLLNKKAKQGIYIEIYVNDFNSKRDLLIDLLRANSRQVFVYEYIGAQNKTQALHAKILTIDDAQSIITSSNLSYNGMEGNLELGVILESKEKAKEIRAIFSSLIDKKYFKRVRL